MWIFIIILTLMIELGTIIGRIGFGSWRQRHKGKKVGHMHHMYVGIFICFFYFFITLDIVLIVGLSLFFSDAIHHFIVLPLWVKRTEFP